eukprot:5521466-Ditylum_brightwellii.AAC.1
MEEEKEKEKNALLEKDHVEVESILLMSDNVDIDESSGTSNNDDDENIPVPKRPSCLPFLMCKRGAICALLYFDPNPTDEQSAASSTADDFGYIASISHPDIIRAIWLHQTDHQHDDIFPH